MNQELLRVYSEFRNLTLSRVQNEKEDGYHLQAIDYLGGDVVSESDWFFPSNNLPDELLALLCEVEMPVKSSLSYEYERIVWQLTGMDEFSA